MSPITRCKILTAIFGGCLILTACQREAAIPADSFRLSVQPVITNNNILVAVLKIRVPHEAGATNEVFLSRVADDGSSHVLISGPSTERFYDGEMALSVSRAITSQTGDFASIHRFTSTKSGSAWTSSGPGSDSVPAAIEFKTLYSISITNGDYKLDTPLEVGKWNGHPVMVTVGKLPR